MGSVSSSDKDQSESYTRIKISYSEHDGDKSRKYEYEKESYIRDDISDSKGAEIKELPFPPLKALTYK